MAELSYLDAAVAVLGSCQRPMTAREMVAEAVRRGLLQPGGKTPEATMSAALYTSVNKDAHTRFTRVHEPGPHRAVRGTVRWALRDH